MAAIPYMPLYIADYLADAAHLSTTQHGAYLLLLMTYWQRGEALPDDDVKLARICRMGPREWAKNRDVLAEFFEVSCSKWVQKRVEQELANVRAKSLQKRKAGLARAEQMHSGRSPNAKRSDTDTDTVAKATDAGASEKEFWAKAKAYIGGSNPGALVGKWCRDYGKQETLRAISAAQSEGAVDPIPYIQRILHKAGAKAAEGVTHGLVA